VPQAQPDMERFAARDAERFPFLAPGKLRDAAGVRPGQPGYNPRTLWLPPNWFKAQKASTWASRT
jgi:DNA mismatch repair protein MSH6